jgi:hypothetical protein
MGAGGEIGFDLRIADVIAYERLTIVLFACECRLVLVLDREPVTIVCPRHGLEAAFTSRGEP